MGQVCSCIGHWYWLDRAFTRPTPVDHDDHIMVVVMCFGGILWKYCVGCRGGVLFLSALATLAVLVVYQVLVSTGIDGIQAGQSFPPWPWLDTNHHHRER